MDCGCCFREAYLDDLCPAMLHIKATNINRAMESERPDVPYKVTQRAALIYSMLGLFVYVLLNEDISSSEYTVMNVTTIS